MAQFALETLGLIQKSDGKKVPGVLVGKAAVFGAGSVGNHVVMQMNGIGVHPFVVDPNPETHKLLPSRGATLSEKNEALIGATHVVICSATDSGEAVIDTPQVDALLEGGKDREIRIVCISRPQAFSYEAIEKLPPTVHIRFDYGPTVLGPVKEKVDPKGEKSNITWSSQAMGTEACKQDLDEAVLKLL